LFSESGPEICFSKQKALPNNSIQIMLNRMQMIKKIFSWRMLVVFILGFSSGVPLALSGGTLKAWLTDIGVDLTTIGAFSLVMLPYSLKFLWSPFTDRYSIPLFGRRRGWLLVAQCGLIAALVGMALSDPTKNTFLIGVIAVLVAFFSATQDIVIDAHRRETLAEDELGFGTSLYIGGYRVGMMLSGGAAIALSDHLPWEIVYLLMAGCLLIGVITVLLSPEPEVTRTPKSLQEAFVEPFTDFFKRHGAWVILAFILFFKLGDQMATEMTMPFYLKIGFSKTEVGVIVKMVAFWAGFLGAFLGGLIIMRIGINRSLWIFGVLQAVSTLGFAVLAQLVEAWGPNGWALGAVISFENLTGGMGTAAYAAYMASLTNRKFTATQYALFSSLMVVPRSVFGAFTGKMAEVMGWQGFFVVCALLALPGMLLLFKVAPWNQKESAQSVS